MALKGPGGRLPTLRPRSRKRARVIGFALEFVTDTKICFPKIAGLIVIRPHPTQSGSFAATTAVLRGAGTIQLLAIMGSAPKVSLALKGRRRGKCRLRDTMGSR